MNNIKTLQKHYKNNPLFIRIKKENQISPDLTRKICK